MKYRNQRRKPSRFYVTQRMFCLGVVLLTLAWLLDLDYFEALSDFLEQHDSWELDEIVLVFSLLGVAATIDVLRVTWTRLEEANQALVNTNAALIQAARVKDEFLAMISHEVRTPLNAILGMTEGLREQIFGSLNERQQQALQTIECNGTHLLELMSDILDLAKLKSGQFNLECAPTDVAALCHSSLAGIKPQAQQKQITITENLPSHLPKVYLDERHLRQVFNNLLSNAVKFTPEGGNISFEASFQQPPAHSMAIQATSQMVLQIAVRDTGIGIDSADLHKLFQPFVQIDSALNRQYSGTGLGLALVKHLVELHGGNVGVTSEVGVGSCFTIYIPCAAAAFSSKPANRSEVDSIPSPPMGGPLILLIGEDAANLKTATTYLKTRGYRVQVVNIAQDIFIPNPSETPDLIMMDILRLGRDELVTLRQTRDHPNLATIPILILASLAQEGDREGCFAAGASEYLSKPIKLKQLVATIQQLLASPSV